MNSKIPALVGLVVLGGSAWVMGGTAGAPPEKTPVQQVAVMGDRIIGWNELAPMLAEAAGAQVLEEYALRTVLKDECGKRGITIGDSEVKAERALLGEMLARASHVPETEGEMLIRDVRRKRGLGDVRFKGLLERNAALRA